MAGIDKLYADKAQYQLLKNWLHSVDPHYPWRIYPDQTFENAIETKPISNFSVIEDFFLWRCCPFSWVQAQLIEQYGGSGSGGPLSHLEQA